MRTVITIEENNPVKVERFEKQLKTGERKTSYELLLKALLKECDIDFVLSYIIGRKQDVAERFNAINSEMGQLPALQEFTSLMIENLDYMRKEEGFQSLALDILKKIDRTLENEELLELLLCELFDRNYYKLDENERLIQLAKSLMVTLSSGNNPRTQKVLAEALIPYLQKQTDSQAIEEWFRLVLRLVDADVLAEESKKRLQSHNQNHGFTTLPKGCVAVTMTDRGPIYVLEVPKAQFRVKLFDIPYENVGHPRLVFVVHFDKLKQEVSELYCAAIKETDVLSEDTLLQTYPYSNVYGSGSVCWRDYPKDFQSIGMLPSLFLSTANNGHLCSDIRQRFETNENHVFDETQLVPLNKKLKNLF